MVEIILILFGITLLYVSISNRLLGFVRILTFQGLLLFVLAFMQLIEVNVVNLVFILLETLVFKAIAMPIFLNYIIKRNNITRETEPFVSYFISLLAVTGIVIGSFVLVQQVEGLSFSALFLAVALATLFTGLYIIISRRKLVTQVMGYIVVENGIFILSLSVGNEMPMIVNTGILIDIFIGVLTMGIFVNKIGDVFKDTDVEYISQMKD